MCSHQQHGGPPTAWKILRPCVARKGYANVLGSVRLECVAVLMVSQEHSKTPKHEGNLGIKVSMKICLTEVSDL